MSVPWLKTHRRKLWPVAWIAFCVVCHFGLRMSWTIRKFLSLQQIASTASNWWYLMALLKLYISDTYSPQVTTSTSIRPATSLL
jgi:hypothetical protein